MRTDTTDSFMFTNAGRDSVNSNSNERQNAMREAVRLALYWKLMRKRIADYVPMCVSSTFVKALVEESTKKQVLHKLSQEHDLYTLMREAPHITKQRKQIERDLDSVAVCRDKITRMQRRVRRVQYNK